MVVIWAMFLSDYEYMCFGGKLVDINMAKDIRRYWFNTLICGGNTMHEGMKVHDMVINKDTNLQSFYSQIDNALSEGCQVLKIHHSGVSKNTLDNILAKYVESFRFLYLIES